jgi:hypothetical protein
MAGELDLAADALRNTANAVPVDILSSTEVQMSSVADNVGAHGFRTVTESAVARVGVAPRWARDAELVDRTTLQGFSSACGVPKLGHWL